MKENLELVDSLVHVVMCFMPDVKQLILIDVVGAKVISVILTFTQSLKDAPDHLNHIFIQYQGIHEFMDHELLMQAPLMTALDPLAPLS